LPGGFTLCPGQIAATFVKQQSGRRFGQLLALALVTSGHFEFLNE
jgi:hypothetical protein